MLPVSLCVYLYSEYILKILLPVDNKMKLKIMVNFESLVVVFFVCGGGSTIAWFGIDSIWYTRLGGWW